MDFSAEQERALSAIREWLKRKDRQVFKLFGYAGSGKTTLAKEVARMVDGRVCYAAFTGKAAQVMRRKGCKDASTIHSLIYEIENVEDGIVEFKLNVHSAVAGAGLVIIDECSMVDSTIGNDLLSFGTKILVIGDPAQLPPIEGAGFFTSGEPDFMLTEVHRQAAGNPIIALSMKIRAGEQIAPMEAEGLRIIRRSDVTPEDVLNADQVIVGLNRTRHLYNARMRDLRSMPPEQPCVGDKVICLRNDRSLGIFNGSLWTVTKIKQKKGKSKSKSTIDLVIESADDDPKSAKSVKVLKAFFNGTEAELDWRNKRGTQEFTFGYAITCHKSQGSQWDSVVVFDESAAFRENRQRWLYTAVTRASDNLTLVLP